MRYFGSKASTLPELLAIVQSRVPSGSFCDPFGGIGTVGAHFKAAGYVVTTGDQLRFARCFQVAKIVYSGLPTFGLLKASLGIKNTSEVFMHLELLRPADGWFTQKFGVERQFFTRDNASRIDAIRLQLQRWKRASLLSDKERDFLVASLINCADRVANTAGTYYAHLKTFHRKAKHIFKFSPIVPTLGPSGQCFLGDAQDLVANRYYDVLYLDPPYNERRYSGYYHLPELLASDCQWRSVRGKSGISGSSILSAFNNRSEAADALSGLVKTSRSRLLIFHYSDDGLIAPDHVRKILSSAGSVKSVEIQSVGYTTLTARRRIMHRVYMVARS